MLETVRRETSAICHITIHAPKILWYYHDETKYLVSDALYHRSCRMSCLLINYMQIIETPRHTVTAQSGGIKVASFGCVTRGERPIKVELKLL